MPDSRLFKGFFKAHNTLLIHNTPLPGTRTSTLFEQDGKVMYKKTCDKCQAWKRDGVDGICRRYAPRPTIFDTRNAELRLVWPKTNPDDGCEEGFIDALEHSTKQ